MVSKNNHQLRNIVTCNTRQRFGLRKLSIGVASVLLGFSWLYASTASADSVSSNDTPLITQVQPNIAENSTGPVENENGNFTISAANQVDFTSDLATSESTSASSPESNATQGSDEPTNSSQVAQSDVGTVDTIYTDDILKDKYGIDINHLDAKSVLMLASLFHIFANVANIGNDVNGNIAAGILNGSHDFGTRGESIHLSKGDIYYIQQLQGALNAGSFRNPEFNHVIFGSDVNVEVRDGKVYVNDQLMENLNPDEVFKDGSETTYIDFAKVFERLIAAADFYTDHETSDGVTMDFSDMNNKYIDVSKVETTDNIIYVNVPAEQLNGPQEIKIYGLSSKENGPTIVVNVVGLNGTIDINTKIHLYYDDNDYPLNNGESHEVANKILWNFGSKTTEVNINSGRFMGSILAPKATVNIYVNVDGNIVADVVNVIGGETHRWDIHPVIPGTDVPDDPEKPGTDTPATPDPEAPDPVDPEGEMTEGEDDSNVMGNNVDENNDANTDLVEENDQLDNQQLPKLGKDERLAKRIGLIGAAILAGILAMLVLATFKGKKNK